MKTLPRIIKQWVEISSPFSILRLLEVEQLQNYDTKFLIERMYTDKMGGPKWMPVDKNTYQDKIIEALIGEIE